ncbi:succinate dehydrogenase assembly factor 2 [Vannielia sp.]|uniref:succinate dehydrogenase assembly factor 2 n=1 Tax=Vannielia sp. TaxID=2813045 RepID=UPI0026045599|nr:succinate dehydrogenase assembly factor 2 [Vannielia sp.]MDF1871474.1 succinate dehydrogenase assembly factor 2 [Vannielia sp.]
MSEETREIRLKRLKIRAWRRGLKEMDLLMGGFADTEMASLSDADLDAFEAVMEEADQDLLRWVTGVEPVPEEHAEMLARICARDTENTPQ